MTSHIIITLIICLWRTCKWLCLQVLLYSLMPYLWSYEYGHGAIAMMALYTALYVVFAEVVPKEKRSKWLLAPYGLYVAIVTAIFYSVEGWASSLFACLVWPIFGLLCVLAVKRLQAYSRKLRTKFKAGGKVVTVAVVLFFVVLKMVSVAWMSREHGSFESEKEDILARRDYLVDELVTTPRKVLRAMPNAIGAQFKGEWALYSCSMLSAALVNISDLYPETREENLRHIDSLISIVLSPELRRYDAARWGEDPLTTLGGSNSHISYLSHLAWMMCGYREAGGDDRYDEQLSAICEAMNRRLQRSEGLNLPTYPGEPIYVPDMLVAIVALDKYAELSGGMYQTTVYEWLERAQRDWTDEDTGILVSFLNEDGTMRDSPIKGSYSALSCYYLTLINSTYAEQQYERVKSLFWKDGAVAGLKEYWDKSCWFGIDIDAGPILLGLSPSGTAFFAGGATFFGDEAVRNGILRTAELAGHTITLGPERHYLLANLALVGESIMLAMRTNAPK